MREDEVVDEGGEFGDEVVSGCEFLARRLLELIGEIGDGVDGEGDQVERDEDGGEVLAAMSQGVFDYSRCF